MNKIYKVVWNTVRNCYVVGSELISSKSGRHSTSNGKSSSLKVTLTVLALCGMTALGSGVTPAYAADAYPYRFHFDATESGSGVCGGCRYCWGKSVCGSACE